MSTDRLMQAARGAVKLEEARDTLRRLLGSEYDARIRPYRRALREGAADVGVSVLVAAGGAAKEAVGAGKPMLALMYLAAACDEIEATP